jgi:hypothetical protein
VGISCVGAADGALGGTPATCAVWRTGLPQPGQKRSSSRSSCPQFLQYLSATPQRPLCISCTVRAQISPHVAPLLCPTYPGQKDISAAIWARCRSSCRFRTESKAGLAGFEPATHGPGNRPRASAVAKNADFYAVFASQLPYHTTTINCQIDCHDTERSLLHFHRCSC